MRKSIHLILTLSLLVFIVSACSKGKSDEASSSPLATAAATAAPAEATAAPTKAASDKPVKIVLGEIKQSDTYKAWADAYTKMHPNVTFEWWTAADHDTYKSKLRMAAQSKSDLPDIFWDNLPSDGLPLIQVGAIMDLTPYMDDKWKKGFVDTALDPATIDGKIWGVPYTTTIEGWYYNKQMFAKYNLEIPKTWDEFKNAIKTFKDKGITPIAFGAKDTWSTWQYQYFLKRFGFYDMRDDILAKKQKFNNPELIKAFQHLKELHDLGAYPKNAATLTHEQATASFVAGQSPIIGGGSWMAAELGKAEFAKDIVMDWGPTFPEGVADQNDAVKDFHTVMMVSVGAKDKIDTVIDFLKFATSKEGAKIDIAKSGGIPATKVDTSTLVLSPLSKHLFEKLSDPAKGFIQLELTMPADFYAPYWDSIVGTTLGMLSPEEALNKLDDWNKNHVIAN